MATKGFEYSLFSELSSLGDNAGSKHLVSNVVDIVKPIAKSRSLKSIEVALNRALPGYLGVKMIILEQIH
jgi:hypothetical protein